MNVNEINFSPSTFIIDNDTFRVFSGNQDDYKKKSSDAIFAALQKVKACEKTEDCLTTLFFEVLKDLAEARKAIAHSHQTEFAHCFGVRRDEAEYGRFHTCLHDVYQPYNKLILSHFSRLLGSTDIRNMKHEKIKVREEGGFQGCSSSFEIEVFDESEYFDVRQMLNDKDRYPADFPRHLLYKEEELQAEEKKALTKANQKFCENNPVKFTKLKVAILFRVLDKNFPLIEKCKGSNLFYTLKENRENLKSFFALGTVRFMVDGKMMVVSEYLVWLYREAGMNPLVKMNNHTTAMVIHQDSFLIQPTLMEIARIFARAVLCDRNDVSELKNRVGVFRAYFSHTMPFIRGSSSVGEYFETLLYHFHGYRVAYNPKKLVDLEALTTPLLSTYMSNYSSMIELEPR